MKKYLISLPVICIICLLACKKNSIEPFPAITHQYQGNKLAPDGFNFSTTKTVSLNLVLKSPSGEALPGILISVYTETNTKPSEAIFKGVTDHNGVLNADLTIPAFLNVLIIDPTYIGLLHNARARINHNTIIATIGGPKGFTGDIIPESLVFANNLGLRTLSTGNIINLIYPSPYTSSTEACVNTAELPLSYGVPKYMEVTGDVIDKSLLTYVNASLPEQKQVNTIHPEYLSSTAVSTINVIEKSDVWITFVAEGAGNLNTLAYYTYNSDTPPTVETDLKNATLIFPNASAIGSGGGLKPGDKVKIGTFQAGTSIGFVLLGSGWNGKSLNTSNPRYFSDTRLNPETDEKLKKHTIVLYDDIHKLTLIGFEDLNRQGSNCDNDFNDIVFYATSNPVTGISNEGVNIIDKANDTDGDGVIDALDSFPNEASKAFINYYPSQSGYATIAFEDNWPAKGDYDMNDLVVQYRYTFISNAKNQVLTMRADYSIAAAGASFKNGFGVQLPVAASAVQSVTGQKFKDNYIQLASNGVEAGQPNAVIIPFDNQDALINNADGSYFVNTIISKNKVQSSVASVLITFTSPVAQATLTPNLMNPFLIANGKRGYEIHLPSYFPTAKADVKLFSTAEDASVPAKGLLYVSKENWPWAISFNTQFTYPLETLQINDAYLHFTDWANSGGMLYSDWYSNTSSNYRNAAALYLK